MYYIYTPKAFKITLCITELESLHTTFSLGTYTTLNSHLASSSHLCPGSPDLLTLHLQLPSLHLPSYPPDPWRSGLRGGRRPASCTELPSSPAHSRSVVGRVRALCTVWRGCKTGYLPGECALTWSPVPDLEFQLSGWLHGWIFSAQCTLHWGDYVTNIKLSLANLWCVCLMLLKKCTLSQYGIHDSV